MALLHTQVCLPHASPACMGAAAEVHAAQAYKPEEEPVPDLPPACEAVWQH